MYSYAELDWSVIGMASSGMHNISMGCQNFYCQHTVKAKDLADGLALVITAGWCNA